MKNKQKRTSRYATKQEILSALRTYLKPDNFESYILIIEHRKVSSKIGLIIVELISGKEVVAIGKATVFPRGISELDSYDWTNLRLGESEFSSFALDTKKQPVSHMLIGAVKKSISEGRIPFLSLK
ncbi:MAG: hypothetical protein WC483_01530 [Candidatus Paceibacterota bacterium]